MMDPVPHFSTFGKDYTRRSKDTDLFEQLFAHILGQCMDAGLVDTSQIFVDATHVKACANGKKMKEQAVHDEVLWYEDELKEEISQDRERHGKKPLKDSDRDDPPSSGSAGGDSGRTRKCSTTDPESGWFRKGEHKHVFTYAMQTACDRNGWILGYTVHPGDEHDSRTFKPLYDKIKGYAPEMVIMDAGYRTPAIAHGLLTDGILPLLPYKRPMTKEGFFKEYEYVYDEYYDCYICPEGQVLTYCTTDREGYREYKSCGTHCARCPSLGRCTHSKSHVKTVTRHVWEEYMETVEDIRHTRGNREVYARLLALPLEAGIGVGGALQKRRQVVGSSSTPFTSSHFLMSDILLLLPQKWQVVLLCVLPLSALLVVRGGCPRTAWGCGRSRTAPARNAPEHSPPGTAGKAPGAYL